MTAVKNSVLFKTLKKAVRKQDHAELLRMLEMVPENAIRGEGFGEDNLFNAFIWVYTPQGGHYWSDLWNKVCDYEMENRP